MVTHCLAQLARFSRRTDLLKFWHIRRTNVGLTDSLTVLLLCHCSGFIKIDSVALNFELRLDFSCGLRGQPDDTLMRYLAGYWLVDEAVNVFSRAFQAISALPTFHATSGPFKLAFLTLLPLASATTIQTGLAAPSCALSFSASRLHAVDCLHALDGLQGLIGLAYVEDVVWRL